MVNPSHTYENYSNPVPTQTKIVFVVDKGGHNYVPTEFAPNGNDHQKATRTHHVRQFFEDHRDNGWYSWSIITFKGRSGGWRGFATPSISHDNKPIFTKDHNLVTQAINNLSIQPDGLQEEGDRDHGKIQYGEALDLAERLIRDDIRKQTDDAYYLVFFISGASTNERALQNRFSFDEYLFPEVEDIVNLKPGRVFFSTAYYGWGHRFGHTYENGRANPDILNVTEILQEMADVGNGQFFNLRNIRGGVTRYQENYPTNDIQQSPCQQAPTSPCNATAIEVEFLTPYYHQSAPSLLSLPDTYSQPEPEVNTVQTPCGALPVPSNILPCGHSVEQHTQGVQCQYR